MKDSPISKNEISSYLKKLAHVLQSNHKTVPKNYTDYQYDEKTKYSQLNKETSKQNFGINESVISPIQNLKIEGNFYFCLFY